VKQEKSVSEQDDVMINKVLTKLFENTGYPQEAARHVTYVLACKGFVIVRDEQKAAATVAAHDLTDAWVEQAEADGRIERDGHRLRWIKPN
jgi:hypothetical protein